jgi:lipoic acid synthetase
MTKIPLWLKEMIGKNKAAYHSKPAQQANLSLHKNGLHTVCEAARCPNRGECFNCGDATFMVLGDICTRGCRFCAVTKAHPLPPDISEPERIAQEIQAWNIRYAVLTMPTRDDLPDGGAKHFARVMQAIKTLTPQVKIEPLISDLQGNENALKIILDQNPVVLGHNVETVQALYPQVRVGADYTRTLHLLKRSKELAPHILTKTGFMVGLGETNEQISRLLKDLRAVGVDLLTIGQYLAPSALHYPVASYPEPKDYKRWEEEALSYGFKAVAAGPLVRSSYHAGTLYLQARLERN